MTGQVRLRVFAGRPDPEWTIPEAVAQQFIQRISAQPLRALQVHSTMAWGMFGRPRIGYHGITLRMIDGRAALYRVHLFDEFIEDPQAGGVRTDVDRTLERQIYATAPPDIVELLGHMTFEQLTNRGNEALISGLHPSGAQDPVCGTGPSSRVDDWIRLRDVNNCYNYANDTLNTNKFSAAAMPGGMKHLPGSTQTEALKIRLRAEIEKDGVQVLEGDKVPAACPTDGFHYMAVILFHLPGSTVVNDFHCLRLDTDGTWWHKSGTQKPRNTDDSGGGPQVISSLSNALFAGNPVLVGVYRAVKNNPRIK